MKHYFSCTTFLAILLPWVAEAAPVSLVRERKPTSVLVLPNGHSSEREHLERLSKHFTRIVKASTGADIPVVSTEEAAAIGSEIAKLYLAPSTKEFPEQTELGEETYRMVSRGNHLYLIAGRSTDTEVSDPLRWALNRLLSDYLNVRFLWPGELGTHTPEHHDFVVPEMDVTHQPALLVRNLRIPLVYSYKGKETPQFLRTKEEAQEWAANQEMGRRGRIRYGHAFTRWWERYSAEHPDYFATPLPGMSSPVQEPEYPARAVKLRLSNPAVIEQIAVEYTEAGAPDFYNVCPTDGVGYDLTPETLAWDIPQGQTLEDIWKGTPHTRLTARYVEFWNRLSARLQQINPKVTLLSYAYSSYRTPPPPERPLTARIMIGIVDSWQAYDSWKEWHRSGALLFLRPNWGYHGAGSPYLPLEEVHRFLQYASKNGMQGFDYDQLMGYWGTEGPMYYLLARMMLNPELSLENIITEYTSAFGAAAPAVRRYLEYWQAHAKYIGTPTAAGGITDGMTSRYRDLVKEKKIADNYLHGPYEALGYLYPDEVLTPAFAILKEAEQAVMQSDRIAWQRVNFLRQGLEQTRLARDAALLGHRLKRGESTAEQEADLQEKAAALDRFRRTLSGGHVMWPEFSTYIENRYKVAIRPRNLPQP